MKKLLVIADLSDSVAVHNFLNSAIGGQEIPSEITKLTANSWLIDAHTSLRFFASLVTAAQKIEIRLVVLPIHDEELIYIPLPQL